MEKRDIAQLIIARLDGQDINKRFSYYRSLVKCGIGGFIVFGGRAAKVRDGIKKLQSEATFPLFIASDLEQGLGQQIDGGTVFPPAMAIASAIDINNKDDKMLLGDVIDTIAIEAKAVGVNVILAPVADVLTNPDNPIICTRSFSDDPKVVGWFVREYVRGIQRHGLIACAKHFPGHGDTSVDSHIAVPTVSADMERLKDIELYPFRMAIKAGVRMVMIGHLMVPAMDKRLSTFSKGIVTGLLREEMGFKGLVITDAMTMRAVYEHGDEAYVMAIKAGADIILHPDSPHRVIDLLYKRRGMIYTDIERALVNIIKTKGILKPEFKDIRYIGRKSHVELSKRVTNEALRIDQWHLSRIRDALSDYDNLALLVIDDDNNRSGWTLYRSLKMVFKRLVYFYVDNKPNGGLDGILSSIKGKPIIIAVYSRVSAYKGRVFLSRRLTSFLKRAINLARISIVIGFCCPYGIKDLSGDVLINAYSDRGMSEGCVAELLLSTFKND
ncbi:MAG: hydrolase [Thermodesulfovibrionia bacterium]